MLSIRHVDYKAEQPDGHYLSGEHQAQGQEEKEEYGLLILASA